MGLREGPLDVVAELNGHPVIIDVLHDPTVLLIGINSLGCHEHVGVFEELIVITDLEYLIPHIEAHDPKLPALSLPIDLEVAKGYLFGRLPHPQPQLSASHDLIPLKVVVLLHPKLPDICQISVELGWVHKELLIAVYI
jgi:hypothetical protein